MPDELRSHEEQKERSDVSRDAISLARRLDRLPPGVYTVRVDKGNSHWQLEISELVQRAERKTWNETSIT